MSVCDNDKKYYNFDRCYKYYIRACKDNDITKIEKYIEKNTNITNNTCINFVCVSLAENKLLKLKLSIQQDVIDKHERDIEELKKILITSAKI